MASPGRKSTIYGEATSEGRGMPVTIERAVSLIDKAGVDPARLDEAVENLCSMVDGGSRLLLTNAPMLEKLMTALQSEINKAVAKFEKLAEDEANHADGEETKPGITLALVTLLDLTGRVSIILDRVDKMVANGVKAKDLVIRLRTFIATGDERDTGLEGKSENELRRFINATANGESVPNV